MSEHAPRRDASWWRYAAFAVLCALLGLGLRVNTLFTGFAADDYAQLAMLEGTYPVERSIFNLFSFSNGTVEENDLLHNAGFYPWFTHRQLRLSMYRPLASALIWVDFEAFGNDALPYHLHSAVWWAAMLFAVAWLFYALLPRRIAWLALALYALDESHTVPLSWIANRCSISSTLFCALGTLAYVRARERNSSALALATFACFALALGFGEYGLCGVPYPVVYELYRYLDARRDGTAAPTWQAALRTHGRALWCVVIPSLAYLVLRSALGHGPLHSGIYVSPEQDFFGFLRNVFIRFPVLYADMAFGLPGEAWTFGSMWSGVLYGQGWVSYRWLLSPAPWRQAHSWLGVLAVIAVLLVWRALRRMAPVALVDKGTPLAHLRWLFWGAALSVVPVVGLFPSSRILQVPAIAFCALLAAFAFAGLDALRARASLPTAAARARAVMVGVLGVSFALYHLVVPARVTVAESAGMRIAARASRKAVLELDADDARLPTQRLVVLAAREYGTSMYIPLVRERFGKHAPKHTWTLSLTPAPHAILRESDNAFRLAPMNGFAMLTTAPEELLTDPKDPLRVGDVVQLDGAKVTVLAVDGPRIQAVRVQTDVSLDDPSLLFVSPTVAGIRRFQMPAVGRTAIVPMPVVPPL